MISQRLRLKHHFTLKSMRSMAVCVAELAVLALCLQAGMASEDAMFAVADDVQYAAGAYPEESQGGVDKVDKTTLFTAGVFPEGLGVHNVEGADFVSPEEEERENLISPDPKHGEIGDTMEDGASAKEGVNAMAGTGVVPHEKQSCTTKLHDPIDKSWLVGNNDIAKSALDTHIVNGNAEKTSLLLKHGMVVSLKAQDSVYWSGVGFQA